LVMRKQPYAVAAVWGLVMLYSIRGWGLLVERWVRPERPVDVGLTLTWGLAAILVVGGTACMLHLASRPFLLVQVLVGAALAAVLSLQRPAERVSRRRLLATVAQPAAYIVLIVALVVVACDYLGPLGNPSNNGNDDPPLYFFLAQKILQTGTMLDPFNPRRITTFGGKVYVDALFLLVGREYQLQVADIGLGSVGLVALLVGAIAPRGLRRANAAHLAVALLLLLTLVTVRANVGGSLMGGIAAVLGVYRTFLWVHDEAPRGAELAVRRIALLAGCVAVASLLRTSNALPAAGFVGLAVILRHATAPLGFAPGDLRRALRDIAVLAGLLFLQLLPWLVTFRESTGTLIYPLSRGNLTPGYEIVNAESGLSFNLRHLINDLSYGKPIRTSLLLLAAGLAPLAWTRARTSTARDFVPLFTVVTFLSICFTSYVGGGFEADINARYYFAFLVATILAIIVSMVPRAAGPAPGLMASPRALLVVAAVVAHATLTQTDRTAALIADIDHTERAWAHASDDLAGQVAATQRYHDMQNTVPAGATIAVAVDEPFRFDLKRNQIFNIDEPGGMGPKPGYPVFKGAEAVADYFLAHGIRYLGAVDFHKSRSLYNLDLWRKFLKGWERSYVGHEARVVVDSMESVESLIKSRRKLYDDSYVRIVDLSQR